MPDRETPEDPIEAIKRRNEERAAKLREKLAAEGAGTFETSIDGAEEPGTKPAAEEFDLGSFPPPPEPVEIPVGERRAPVTVPPAAAEPGIRDIELPPPPDFAETFVPDIEMRREAPDLEIEITPPWGVPEILAPAAPELPITGPDLDFDITPPDITEIPFAPVEAAKIAEIELPEEVEFPLPEAWEGAAAPEFAAAPVGAPEPVAEAFAEPARVEARPVEAVREALIVEKVVEPPIVEGLELPEIPPIEVPVGEIIAPVPVEPAPEPAEAIAEEPLAVEPTVAEPAVIGEPFEEPPEEELTIKVAIEVTGTKVRITRENIALDDAVDLFRKITERYENR